MGALFEIYIEPGFFPYEFFYSNLNWKKRMSSNFELIYSNQINPSHVILWLNPKSTNINFDCKIIIFEFNLINHEKDNSNYNNLNISCKL